MIDSKRENFEKKHHLVDMVGKKPQVPTGFRQDHGQENPSTVTEMKMFNSP